MMLFPEVSVHLRESMRVGKDIYKEICKVQWA